MNNTLTGRLRELKIKGIVLWGNPTSGRSRLRELLLQSLSQFERGFTKVVVTGTCRLREWSQGELRLYSQTVQCFEYVKSGYLL